ncbi:MAG: hypothetical protein HYV09_22365 [Deltaproteobacteria bacterium]|nr:hypothetical protein [Deltaproteobacteria bacterium]
MARLLRTAALIASSAALDAASAAAPAPVAAVRYFEDYSAITMEPSVERTATEAATLVRWLEVRTAGALRDVVFRPDGRVTWKLWYGAHGLVEKRAFVDGALWSTSVFGRDAAGRLATKTVTFASGSKQEHDYKVDAAGRVLERARRGGGERWSVTWSATGAVAETTIGKDAVRRDTFDGAGRVIESRFGKPLGKAELVLRRTRDAAGKLLAVQRITAAGGLRPAEPLKRDKTVTVLDVTRVPVGLERHEVLLLFGAPAKHSDTGSGVARTITDDYADGCWLNAPSTLDYDATALFTKTQTTCICGFCVDARLAPHAADRTGFDAHWTRGPWVRLDGWIDVTADHEILTPTGPRPCGELVAGDEVLDDRGEARPLLSIERLPPTFERLGVNVRTTSGRFFAGGLAFASEGPRACP